MKIKFKDYTLEPEGRNYNLYKTVTVTVEKATKTRKIGDTYLAEKSLGYSFRFETALEVIIKDMLADEETAVTLREYIDEYKRLKEEVLINTKTK